MKILVVGGDCWNDSTNGNNVYSNWFDDFDAEFANIYIGQGTPENKVCSKYFQITDRMMFRSLYSDRAGVAFNTELCKVESESFDKDWNIKVKRNMGEGLRIAREVLWSLGRYNIDKLKSFIDNFNPDIVFCTHIYSLRYGRLVRLVHSMTDAPMVGFAGDAEASLKNYSLNPLYWIRQFSLYFTYPKHIKQFKQYFTFSQKQCEEITAKYGVPAEPLYKCIQNLSVFEEKKPNEVLKLVYAGRLYCNRWKTLSAIGDALIELNKSGKKAELFIYSQDELTVEQEKALSKERFINFMGSVHPSELPTIYRDADIALHVESFDKKYKLDTMHSLSTKIIDLMSSTCAILAICWEKNNGWNYLKDNDAAFCLSDYFEILPLLKKIDGNRSLISVYAKKAYECGIKNHNKDKIHGQIRNQFSKLVNS